LTRSTRSLLAGLFDQILRHRVRDRARLRVIHLHRDGALGGCDVLPQLRVSTIAVQQYLDFVAGIDVRPGVKLDAAREQRVCDRGRSILVPFRDNVPHRRVVGDGKDANQRQHQREQQQGCDCYVLDQ